LAGIAVLGGATDDKVVVAEHAPPGCLVTAASGWVANLDLQPAATTIDVPVSTVRAWIAERTSRCSKGSVFARCGCGCRNESSNGAILPWTNTFSCAIVCGPMRTTAPFTRAPRALLSKRWDDMNDYTKAKTDVIVAIKARAREARGQ
jgi:hypothetical protein